MAEVSEVVCRVKDSKTSAKIPVVYLLLPGRVQLEAPEMDGNGNVPVYGIPPSGGKAYASHSTYYLRCLCPFQFHRLKPELVCSAGDWSMRDESSRRGLMEPTEVEARRPL